MSDEEEAPGIESRIPAPDLSCPKCNNLLPNGLGVITCVITKALAVSGAKRKSVVLNVRKSWSVELERGQQICNVHLAKSILF